MNSRKRKITLFKGTAGYEDGGQIRDFIYVNDVVNVIFYFWEHPELSGIYNCGTGVGHTFNEFVQVSSTTAAKAISNTCLSRISSRATSGHAQADTENLMKAGYDKGFTILSEAVKEYCKHPR